MALSTLIAALILGIVIGPLARLLVPGKQDINLIMTILIGAVGALTGSVVVSAMTSAQGLSLWALLAGLGVAVLLVVLYTAVAGERRR